VKNRYVPFFVITSLSLVFFAGCQEKYNLPDGLYAKIATKRGAIICALENEKAPMTVMNFVGLAEGTIDNSINPGGKFFDGLLFYRVDKGSSIESGDPEGQGGGGPGYFIPDEFSPDLKFDKPGVLAMSNNGPNSNGSRFMITLKAMPELDGKNTIFGHVVVGLETANSIVLKDTSENITIIRQGKIAADYKADQAAFSQMVSAAKKKNLDSQIALIESKFPNTQKSTSGLKYRILKKGTGQKPGIGSKVTVNYTGSLPDGTVYDSTIKNGKPAQFKIGTLIKGINETAADMQKGEKRIVIIPPELAYGAKGVPNFIPPDSYIVFEMELLDFSNE
jgi:FKBP-type peptidyl-prolyl cis-trans isomerase